MPASVNFTGLEIRLMTTWMRRSRSPVICRQAGVDLFLQAQAFLLEERRRGGRRPIDDLADGDALHVPFELARFDLGEIQHVIDQLR